jgi:hypothetical protein
MPLGDVWSGVLMKQINNLDKRELRELICFFQYIGDTT